MSNKNKYGMSPCIGETSIGLPYPIFYDPHYPIKTKNPPVTLVTGAPGSGKTFFGMLVASQANIFGKNGFIIDPKGDFSLLYQLQKEKYINEIEIWTILETSDNNEKTINEENEGMLDPMVASDIPSYNSALTMDTIEFLNGGLSASQRIAVSPIVKDISEGPSPSLAKVEKKLYSHPNDEIRVVGSNLRDVLDIPLSKIFVRNTKKPVKRLSEKESLVIVNLLGLDLPDPDSAEKKNLNSFQKISMTIIRLICQMVFNSMWTSAQNKVKERSQKLLMVDEAWILMSTEAGKNLIRSTARLGRSIGLATILFTQSSKHIYGTEEKINDFDTVISTRFAFKNNDIIDNRTTCKSMQLPEGDGWENVIRKLENGQCLMCDCNYNTAIVDIVADERWIPLFNTTPIKD